MPQAYLTETSSLTTHTDQLGKTSVLWDRKLEIKADDIIIGAEEEWESPTFVGLCAPEANYYGELEALDFDDFVEDEIATFAEWFQDDEEDGEWTTFHDMVFHHRMERLNPEDAVFIN